MYIPRRCMYTQFFSVINTSVMTVDQSPLSKAETSQMCHKSLTSCWYEGIFLPYLGQAYQGYVKKKRLFTYFNLLFLCLWLQVINMVNVTYQGQTHTSRSRSNQCQDKMKVTSKERYSNVDGLHLNQMCSRFLKYIFRINTLSHIPIHNVVYSVTEHVYFFNI